MQSIDFAYITAGSALHLQAVNLRYQIFFQPFGVPPEEVIDQLEEKSFHLAAVSGDLAIGYGRLTLVNGCMAQISQLVVEPGFRKSGVGSELLRRLMTRAGEMGATTVFLNSRLPLMAFYARFGFAPVGAVFCSSKTDLPHRRMELSLLVGEAPESILARTVEPERIL